MEPIINFANIITILLALVLFVLVLILGKETHKSQIVALMLFAFLAILVGHSVEMFAFEAASDYIHDCLRVSLIFDFIFIFLSFFSFLWVDDIQAKIEKKKSIDNSLDWFWKEV